MQLAVMTEPHLGGTYEELLAAARFAEEAGLVGFLRSDHYLSTSSDPPPAATDAFATVAGLARETDRIRLGILVTPITFRHPAVIAKMAATIDQMSGGRLELGVGTGWMEAEHEAYGLPFPPFEERFERLEETLLYLRAAFSEAAGEHHGKHYRLGPVDARPKPLQDRLPLIVGGSGKRRTPQLAGRLADEYNPFIGPPAEVAEKVAVARQAAREAGRSPEDLRISAMGPVLVGRTEAEYRERLAAAAASRGRTPEEHEARYRELGIPAGARAQAGEALQELEEAGVQRYYVQFLDVADLDAVKDTFDILLG